MRGVVVDNLKRFAVQSYQDCSDLLEEVTVTVTTTTTARTNANDEGCDDADDNDDGTARTTIATP